MLKDKQLLDLNLPSYNFRLKNMNDKAYIFDDLRKKYIRLTPEEWVRQNYIHYLMDHLSYPAGKIGNEIEIKLNGLSKRCDSVVYNTFGNAIAIIEYKAPHIELDQKVFDQIFSYNLKMKVPYLFLSNGIQHITCKIENARPVFLENIPDYHLL